MALISPMALAACAPAAPVAEDFIPEYLGAVPIVLADDLVLIEATMTNAQNSENLRDYTECAVAAYALSKGYGFARHLRTNLNEEGGVWSADAVYTISPALPACVSTIDADVTVAACAEAGIPTV
jgi:hypothetical protein